MNPMRRCLPLLLVVNLLSACGGSIGGETSNAVASSDWMADLRITAQDTTVRLCGSGKRYHLTGPALDTLADRYRMAVPMHGRWAKVWFHGRIGARMMNGLADSVLFAEKYQHLDASLRCDPVPDPRISGSYWMDSTDPSHPRTVRLDLLLNGDVTMHTDFHDGRVPLEEDGRWGTDADGRVVIEWPKRELEMTFTWDTGRLMSDRAPNGMALTLTNDGPADRLRGQFGRVARWLATSATRAGKPVNASDLLPSTPMEELFATDEARRALALEARDTLHFDTLDMKLRWANVATVQDVVEYLRSAPAR